jgi:hypothetical protein
VCKSNIAEVRRVEKMIDIFLKIYDSFSDASKRFEDRVLSAAQLLGQCHAQWFLELSKSLKPLMVSGNVEETFDLYTSFLYEQANYQLPASQAISVLHEAETRILDAEIRAAMVRLRLGTFLVFRWLDMRSGHSDSHFCSFCYILREPSRRRFGDNVDTTWALLKYGNEFLIQAATPLDEFLKQNGKIALPNGPEVSIDEIRLFLKSQLDAINSLLTEMATDIGIIHARSDFLSSIDLRKPGRPPETLMTLAEEDNSRTQIYKLIIEAERFWNVGLLTERQEELSLGINNPGR